MIKFHIELHILKAPFLFKILIFVRQSGSNLAECTTHIIKVFSLQKFLAEIEKNLSPYTLSNLANFNIKTFLPTDLKNTTALTLSPEPATASTLPRPN